MSISSYCPLTGKAGRILRKRNAAELASTYASYCGAPLPAKIIEKYFTSDVYEYYLESSGLRWYAPSELGDGDYYAALGRLYAWYYNPGSWDKVTALMLLTNAGAENVAEVGSGSGWLLSKLQSSGMRAIGVEINPDEVNLSREHGLDVYFPSEIAGQELKCDWLCLLQTIEHVTDPAGFIGGYIRQFNPKSLVISAPCFEGLLGYTRDPLSWPPHHATAWSEKAFHTLGESIGYRIKKTLYSPLSFERLDATLRSEGSRKLPSLPYIPKGRVGRYLLRICQILRLQWACRGHSILVVMERAD